MQKDKFCSPTPYLSLGNSISSYRLSRKITHLSNIKFIPVGFCEENSDARVVLKKCNNLPIFSNIGKLKAVDLANAKVFPDGFIVAFNETYAQRQRKCDRRFLTHLLRLLLAIRPQWILLELTLLTTNSSKKSLQDFFRAVVRSGYIINRYSFSEDKVLIVITKLS